AILIFPEGVSQPEPALMPLRTGTARLLLGAARDSGPAATLLPVGLMFREPGTFRAGSALVLVGEPVPTADLAALPTRGADVAVRRLTERLGEALQRLIVEAHDRRILDLVHAAESIWREEMPEAAREPKDRAAWRQRAARAYHYLAAVEPIRVAALRSSVERHVEDLERAALTDRDLSRGYRAGPVVRYAFREGSALLLGLPLALWGVIIHLLPYKLTALAVRALRPEEDVLATYKVMAGLVLYPAAWAPRRLGALRLRQFLLRGRHLRHHLRHVLRDGRGGQSERGGGPLVGSGDLGLHGRGRRHVALPGRARRSRGHSPPSLYRLHLPRRPLYRPH